MGNAAHPARHVSRREGISAAHTSNQRLSTATYFGYGDNEQVSIDVGTAEEIRVYPHHGGAGVRAIQQTSGTTDSTLQTAIRAELTRRELCRLCKSNSSRDIRSGLCSACEVKGPYETNYLTVLRDDAEAQLADAAEKRRRETERPTLTIATTPPPKATSSRTPQAPIKHRDFNLRLNRDNGRDEDDLSPINANFSDSPNKATGARPGRWYSPRQVQAVVDGLGFDNKQHRRDLSSGRITPPDATEYAGRLSQNQTAGNEIIMRIGKVSAGQCSRTEVPRRPLPLSPSPTDNEIDAGNDDSHSNLATASSSKYHAWMLPEERVRLRQSEGDVYGEWFDYYTDEANFHASESNIVAAGASMPDPNSFASRAQNMRLNEGS